MPASFWQEMNKNKVMNKTDKKEFIFFILYLFRLIKNNYANLLSLFSLSNNNYCDFNT